MKEEFKKLLEYYQNDEFIKIFSDKLGNYFLKMRSISRVEILRELATQTGISIEGIDGKRLFEYMFCQNIEVSKVDNFIRNLYASDRRKRFEKEDELYSQLHKIRDFYWGGFYQNAVEKTIVDQYIKKIRNYQELCNVIEKEINPKLKGYILCSWYNHWTSILIEDMFKEHNDILPAIGLVKKVDFFWHNFPFDLKVTYFPNEFMKDKRRELGLRPEFTELKQFARANKIPFDNSAKDDEIFEELMVRITEHSSRESRDYIKKFHETRKKIVENTLEEPKELIKWFYENQGERRFDAANRFFLVLINIGNLEDSWKLKRNKDLLKSEIKRYLEMNRRIDFKTFKVEFNWKGKVYVTYSTCLFVIKY